MERSKSTSSGDRDDGSEDKVEENTNTTRRLSAASISVDNEANWKTQIVRKKKVEANWKRIAREKGKNKSPTSDTQPVSIGSKRAGKLIFEEKKDVSHKRQCTTTTID